MPINFKTYEVTTDLINSTSLPTTIRFSQNDQNSAKLLLNITNKTVEMDLSDATAVRISFKKPDGTRVFQDDCQAINALKGKYQVVLRTQTLAAIGNVIGQVQIVEGNRTIETQKFVFVVDESLSNDDAIESTNEYGIIQKVIEAGEKLEEVDIPSLVASKETAEAAKQKADDNDIKIENLQKDVNDLKQNGGGSGGILSFQTLADLQTAFPNGTDKPVWIISENVFYYWDTTPADTTPPSNVTNLITSNVTGTTATLSWNASSSGDTVGYDIYNGSTFITTVTGTTYNVGGLSQNTSYTFWVKAKDGSGNVASGTSINVTTTNTTPSDTTPPVVTANPNGGTFASSQNITLSANETAAIYYTTDGSTPTTSSNVYSSPIPISATTTLKFFGKDTAGNSSAVQTATYTIDVSGAKKLSLDGAISTYLSFPSFAFDTVEITMEIPSFDLSKSRNYWSYSGGSIYRHTSGVDRFTAPITNVYVDGVGPKTYGTSFINTNTVTTLKFGMGSVLTGASSLFSSLTGADNNLAGFIHEVKFYNAGVIVCRIDTSSGDVLDKSGNGRNGVLHGNCTYVAK